METRKQEFITAGDECRLAEYLKSEATGKLLFPGTHGIVETVRFIPVGPLLKGIHNEYTYIVKFKGCSSRFEMEYNELTWPSKLKTPQPSGVNHYGRG